MSEQTEMATGQEKRTQVPQTYVVQIERELPHPRPEGIEKVWEDIATVTVPPRTSRKTVIKRALAEAGVKPSEKRPKLRALDVDSAKIEEPEAHQPPPEWKL